MFIYDKTQKSKWNALSKPDFVWQFDHEKWAKHPLELTCVFLYWSPAIITCGFQTITGNVTRVVP